MKHSLTDLKTSASFSGCVKPLTTKFSDGSVKHLEADMMVSFSEN
jgi:hypothetical protein